MKGKVIMKLRLLVLGVTSKEVVIDEVEEVVGEDVMHGDQAVLGGVADRCD